MIEARIIEYLAEALDIPVYAEVPEDAAGEFLVVEKTGSARTNYLDEATIAVQSYADSLSDAAFLNQRVKAAILNLWTQDDVSAVRLNSDYNFTDTTTRRYRYQGVYVVTYYE